MPSVADFLQLDLPALLVAVLGALVCALPGNFLILRRQGLIGDAISHVVLPGIVLGFLLSGSTATLPMMLGAGAAAILSVGLIELVQRLGRLESEAAMGVVFTTLFAAGLVLLEQSAARDVHIDVQHSLYGNVEGTVWLGARDWSALWDPVQLARLPDSILRLAGVALLMVLLMVAFFKELKLATFDPALADSLGFSSRWLSFGLVVMTAVAAVAAFDAVGSILVIAMFICPPATARLLTDNLATQLLLSAGLALLSGVLGYWLAAFGPFWVGLENSLNAAGMIAVVAGLLQLLAMLFAPHHGVLPRRWRQRREQPGAELGSAITPSKSPPS